jgi:DNA polymerase-3 subunit beta
MSFGDNRLTMRALTQDVGQAEETLDIEFSGEPFEIGFNPGYLIEGVDAVDDDATVLRFTSPLRPGLVSGPGDDFTYLIMPIRLSN